MAPNSQERYTGRLATDGIFTVGLSFCLNVVSDRLLSQMDGGEQFHTARPLSQ